MANCYLCQYVTEDLRGTPTRMPAGASTLSVAGTPWGSIDLSSDGRGGGKNWAFLATTGTLAEQTVAPKIVLIGTEAVAVNNTIRNRVGAELGLTVPASVTTLAALVEFVLVSQGLVVRPERDGMVRIYLGPVLLVERAA